MKNKNKIHYQLNKNKWCNNSGRGGFSTPECSTNIEDVTCKTCLKRLKKNIQENLEIKKLHLYS